MSTQNLEDFIALALLPGVGSIHLRRLLDTGRQPAEIAFRMSPDDLVSGSRNRGDRTAAIVESRRTLRRRAERERRWAEKSGIRLLVAGDPDFPAALTELPDTPILLYVRGRLSRGVTRVSIVGSRAATHYGKQVATGLAAGLASRGIEVVSGGARGIDTSAHRGALAQGGPTVAVVGSGLARPYPPENDRLFDEIAETGAVISEIPLDFPPRPENFPRRNRLISGLSCAVVVVEANRRSGSLSTAGHALEQGREVLAVPGPVSSERSVGCHRLIQQGAKLVQNLEDILEELSPVYRGAIAPPAAPAGDRAKPDLFPDETAILALLEHEGPLQIDNIAEQAPFSLARVQAALFGLELHGVVQRLPGLYYASRNIPRSRTESST